MNTRRNELENTGFNLIRLLFMRIKMQQVIPAALVVDVIWRYSVYE
ncbi:MAG: hypothetical protein ABFD08_11055 [Syntrophomonas sp.]